MKPSVRLGRIAGIQVGAHWSVLVILLLVAEALATAILPSAAKGSSHGVYWTVGVVVAVVFFACLLAHEAAHAVVARRYGVPVKGITLWMLGGVTELEGEAPDARAEFRIAVCGPAVSVGCALAAGAAAFLADIASAPSVLTAGLVWLAITNGLLAVFNMLPGAPLDGGRVLRAVMWRRTGNRARASLTASRAGRFTGLTFMGLGTIEVLLTGQLIGGLWLVFIGWFLVAAAGAEAQATVTEVGLGNLTVGEVMQPVVTVVPVYQEAAAAARRATEADADLCVVCDFDGRPVGLVTVDRLIAAAGRAGAVLRVGDVAARITEGMVAVPGERLSDALRRAIPSSVLVVVEDGRLVGLVTPTEVTHARRRGLLTATT